MLPVLLEWKSVTGGVNTWPAQAETAGAHECSSIGADS